MHEFAEFMSIARMDANTGRAKSCAEPDVVNGGSVRGKQEVVMKLTSVKSMVMKGVTVGLVAGAVALAAPAKAQAQQFAVGVQFGSPGYGYVAPGDYYARQRYEELCRERAFA